MITQCAGLLSPQPLVIQCLLTVDPFHMFQVVSVQGPAQNQLAMLINWRLITLINIHVEINTMTF